MRFEAKTYKRLGVMTGSIIGVLLMIGAICLHRTKLGAVLLITCACMGVIVGNIVEKKTSNRTSD